VSGTQYLLKDEGWTALNQLLNLVYPGGKKLNKAKIAEHTGVRRDTLNRIFGTAKNPDPLPVQCKTLEKVFEELNKQVKRNYREENRQGDKECDEDYKARIREGQKALKHIPFHHFYMEEFEDCQSFPTLPVDFTPETRSLSVSSSIPLDNAQTLAQLLLTLDYAREEAEFKSVLVRLKHSGAFMVRCEDTKARQWLVKRLAKAVGFFETAEKISINVGAISRIDELWSKFPDRLRHSPISSDAMIKTLGQLCQDRPVIIVLSRFHRADQEMQNQVIDGFWKPLLAQVNALSSNRKWKSRLVLFLLEEGGDIHVPTVPPGEAQDPEYPVLLPPLVEIKSSDVEAWFNDEVFDLLVQRRGEMEAEKILQNTAAIGSKPWNALEDICNEFGYEITDVEKAWGFAG
jgi:inactive STAND